MRELTGPELIAMHDMAMSSPRSAAGEARSAASPMLLLDVREAWEVALGAIHLAGTQTLHMPMNEVPARLAELDPAQPVVCICHHGMRSAQVVAFLSHHGFDAAYNLAGGTDAWSEQVDPNLPRY